ERRASPPRDARPARLHRLRRRRHPRRRRPARQRRDRPDPADRGDGERDAARCRRLDLPDGQLGLGRAVPARDRPARQQRRARQRDGARPPRGQHPLAARRADRTRAARRPLRHGRKRAVTLDPLGRDLRATYGVTDGRWEDVDLPAAVGDAVRRAEIAAEGIERHGAFPSVTKGAAGGPSTVSTPGGEGMLSPRRTSPIPLTSTPLLPSGPITSGYGTPETELTIWQIEPATASGIPLAVTAVCGIWTITPLSGGPAAPGVTTTAQPMETGGPGITRGRSSSF